VLPRDLMMWRGPVDRPEIALTLDDGPDPYYTPRILQILKAERVHATFFLIGAKAAEHGDLVARILADGHEIGNHSYSHPHFGTLSWSAAKGEISRTRGILDASEPGPARRLFRPPFGVVSAASTLVPWLKGETVVLWNVDFKDFSAEAAADITDHVAARRFTPGDIILYHGHNPAALEALPNILQSAQREGLGFVPVSRMCQPRARA
jgi:peptidoglycan/xylan/chitin deacetylase (PgdA/CDA1 family)